jgi:hypothetical protein
MWLLSGEDVGGIEKPGVPLLLLGRKLPTPPDTPGLVDHDERVRSPIVHQGQEA